MSVAKTASSLMLGSGALTYFGFSEIVNTAKGGIDVIGSGVENTWNNTEDKYRQAGDAVGGVIGGAAMVYPNFKMLMDEQKRYGRWFDGKPLQGGLTEARLHQGVAYEALEGGGYKAAGRVSATGTFTALKGQSEVKNATLLKTLEGKGTKEGIIRRTTQGAKFMAGEGTGLKALWHGMRPFAYMMAVGWAAKSALGFAGGIVDEAVKDDHRSRRIHYDNRFFNTQQDQMSNYQQLGAAMNNYENRMQSTARIYHSR